MISFVILNSIALGVYDYMEQESSRTRNLVVDIINIICFVVFIFEATVKIVAMGFVLEKS